MVAASYIAALRRMITGPTSVVYTDLQLSDYIEARSAPNLKGKLPTDNGWTPTYDLNAAAADVWEETAVQAVGNFDFSADGGNYSRSQVYEQCMKMVRHFRSRSGIRTIRSVVDQGH